MSDDSPVLPRYDGGCIASIVPALLEAPTPPTWLPEPARDARQTVLLVLDGLGWEQLCDHRSQLPTIAAMQGGPITSVAPSTTATALTSIATGLTPGEHGIVGYRMAMGHDVLNTLRWSDGRGDARATYAPDRVQPVEAFLGHRPPVVTKAEFATTGFTGAHLVGARFHGYRMASTMIEHVRRLVVAGESFVYAYYEGIDKVAHEFGLGDFYRSELCTADRVVAQLLDVLPSGVALLVTADHGHLETGDQLVEPHRDVLAATAMQSGEGRLRWFHARPGRLDVLADALRRHHGGQAWVRTKAEAIAEGWFGPVVGEAAASRLGDVCLAAKGTLAFVDPDDSGPYELVGRHGSLTSAEMFVPLVATRV